MGVAVAVGVGVAMGVAVGVAPAEETEATADGNAVSGVICFLNLYDPIFKILTNRDRSLNHSREV